MDLNPKQFKASWQAYEFSSHALVSGSEMLVLSMAWLTRLESSELGAQADQPDLDTLSYWIERLTPVVEGQKEVVVVCANRCGEEGGKNPLGEEEGVRYAGTSWVGLVGNGLVRIWGIMGRAAEGVLVVDTAQEPQWVLRMRGRDGDSAVQESCRFGVGENSLLST